MMLRVFMVKQHRHCIAWINTMENIARFLMLAGAGLFLVGGILFLVAKLGLPLGRLPGDIRLEGENGLFYFPLATSLLVSIVLTVLLNLLGKFWNR